MIPYKEEIASMNQFVTLPVSFLRSLALAEDEVTIDDISEELLACSKKTLEDYFVVPPGNIPYLEEKGYYNELKDKNENL